VIDNGKSAENGKVQRREKVQRKGHVLVLESDGSIRELLERWLTEAGYAVVAGDLENRDDPPAGGEAPCLVIANVSIPRAAQPLIQSLQAVYAAPILVLSGRFRRGLAGSAEAARRLGVAKVLPKPFTRKELLSAVRESLEAAG
jgi:DNA-binding response OmpR family regulator